MRIENCPINDLDYYGEYPCEYEDEISYKHCYKCACDFLEELKKFIEQLKKEE